MRGEPIGSTTLIIGASGGLKIKWINDESGSHVIDTETDNSVFVHVCHPLWNDFPLIAPTSTTATSHPSTHCRTNIPNRDSPKSGKKKKKKIEKWAALVTVISKLSYLHLSLHPPKCSKFQLHQSKSPQELYLRWEDMYPSLSRVPPFLSRLSLRLPFPYHGRLI